MSIEGEAVARHVAHLVGAGLQRAHQDVVDVGGDHQPLDRQAHALRHIAGEDVAEIAGRHREGDLAMRRAERDRGGEVVDHLRDDARPVDRVDAGEPHAVAEGVMIEQALHDRLAVVERAFDRERMHVRLGRRRHHAPLHLGDAAVRIEHDDVDLVAAAERLDRGAAGVARGRDHDGRALAALRQRMIHQPREELHRQVLEGERRAVEQLEHEGAGRQAARAARPPDGGTCRRRRAPCATRSASAIAPPTNGRTISQATSAYGRPASAAICSAEKTGHEFRHIEAAVAGEPGERDVDEAERGGFASGGNVAHRR